MSTKLHGLSLALQNVGLWVRVSDLEDDFPYEKKLVGYVKGFERKFYQYSTDHRGTPETPGRVVTLVPSQPESKVWGIAYKIRHEDKEEVLRRLDLRERGGYQRRQVAFHPREAQEAPFAITIYVGTWGNLNYAGEADKESIAKQIVNAAGPSGSNIEYVCNLADAMREIAPHVYDHHLFSVEAKVLALLKGA